LRFLNGLGSKNHYSPLARNLPVFSGLKNGKAFGRQICIPSRTSRIDFLVFWEQSMVTMISEWPVLLRNKKKELGFLMAVVDRE